jgi:hypothetical protein
VFLKELFVSSSCPLNYDVSATVNGSNTFNSYSNAGEVVRPAVNGGVAPFSYSWIKLSGSGNITSGSTTLTPTVMFMNVPNEGMLSGAYRLQVTDSIGQVAAADLTLYAEYFCQAEFSSPGGTGSGGTGSGGTGSGGTGSGGTGSGGTGSGGTGSGGTGSGGTGSGGTGSGGTGSGGSGGGGSGGSGGGGSGGSSA